MFCSNCGAQVNDNLTVCPNCGAIMQGNKPNVTAASTYVGPMGDPTPVLTWGIIGLAISCVFGIIGLIFSLIGLKKYNNYKSFTSGAYSRQAEIGKKLSIAGIIVSIAVTVFWILYVVVIVLWVNKYTGSLYC
ncbi:MAG: zinc-ribbon domain-containing protein [Clostridia bacterium]|nr:zinc-ribbon domain-containing protein [Clostridia bacterium]